MHMNFKGFVLGRLVVSLLAGITPGQELQATDTTAQTATAAPAISPAITNVPLALSPPVWKPKPLSAHETGWTMARLTGAREQVFADAFRIFREDD
jgi:hypothetical protein